MKDALSYGANVSQQIICVTRRCPRDIRHARTVARGRLPYSTLAPEARSRLRRQQGHADDDQPDADPPRARQRLSQESMGEDRDDDEGDAADRKGGADLDKLKGARVDQGLQDEQRHSRADPPPPGVRRQRRLLEEHLRDAFDDAAQQDEQHPGRGGRHCRIALLAPLWCSVRLMNQTPANTKAMTSTFSASTLSSR